LSEKCSGMVVAVKAVKSEGILRQSHGETVGKVLKSANLYHYTFNNPVNHIDPWGLFEDFAGYVPEPYYVYEYNDKTENLTLVSVETPEETGIYQYSKERDLVAKAIGKFIGNLIITLISPSEVSMINLGAKPADAAEVLGPELIPCH